MRKKLLFILLSLSMGSVAQNLGPESFEGDPLPETGMIAGWTVYQELANDNKFWKLNFDGSGIGAHTGSHAVYMINDNNFGPGYYALDWLVSPQFTAEAGTHLRFYTMFQSNFTYAYNPTCMVMIVPAGSDLSNINNYTMIEQFFPIVGDFTEIDISLPESAIGNYHIAFLYESSSQTNGNTLVVDDVRTLIPCPAPANLTVTDFTLSSALLSWDANNAQEWEVEVVSWGQGPTGAGVLVNEASYEATDLPMGNYRYYVRAICEDENSYWAGPYFFSIMNGITGTVSYDADGDGDCDENDSVIPSMEIDVTIGGETYSVYTNEDGEYALYGVFDGVTSVGFQLLSLPGFPDIPATNETVSFSNQNPFAVINHCLPEPAVLNDLTITLVPFGNARPGLQSHYDVVVRNMGTTVIAAATVTVSFNDTKLDFVSATGTNSVSGNMLTFTLNDVQPFSTHHLNAAFLVIAPPENIGGEILVFNGNVTPTQDDITPDDNAVVLNQTIVNSYDPNDITVHEGPTIYEEQTDDYLHYTIRFQNMGTAEAIDVRVENVLDENLDWSTFEPEASSDSYTVTRNGEHVKFYFNSINLPYEAADEPGSHGYISYRIKPKSAFGLGDIAYNDAGIFFDFNEPVLTNEVSTEVIEEPTAGLIEVAVQGVAVYPNPVKNVFTVQAINETVSLIEVYDINGRLCLSQSNGTNVNVQSLNNGLYFVKVTTEKGITNKKIMKQ